MADRAKHAFGALERVDAAITSGTINAYDILFVKDENGKPYVGWVDKDGNKVIVESDKVDLSGIEAELATKANASEVDSKINNAVTDTVEAVKSYTDGKVEAAMNEHLTKKYEITSTPKGALVNYHDKEIRVMCPADTQWVKQNVGSTGNANMYYMGFKAYAPEGAVGFKEGDQGVVKDEYFDFSGDFAGTDEFGRNYSICWLALASYDEGSETWTYFGKNSSVNKYIGWTYVVEWYDSNGVIIASDSVRINLSNENCHSSIEPYYVGTMMTQIDTKIEEKVAEKIEEVNSAYEVIEF